MRILLLVPALYYKGGANLIALKIGKYLIDKGEYVEIWSDRVDLSSTHSFAKDIIIRKIGIKALSDNPKISKLSRILSFVPVPQNISEFDLINYHNFPSYFASLSPYCKEIPSIWHCNEPSVVLYPLPDQIGVHNFRVDEIVTGTLSRCILKSIDKIAVKRINKIIALNRYVQRRVRLIYGRDSQIMIEGTDIEKFNPHLNPREVRKKHEIYDRPCILTVGSFTKRMDLILYALRTIKKEVKDVMLVIVCGADDPSILRNMIKKYGCEKNTIVVKDVPDQDLPLYYSACDVFVFPQPYWSWSLATIEAMACGKTVIVPNTCGIADIIDNNNGIKIDILNTKNLAACVVNLLKDDNTRKRIGRAARRYVESNLNEKDFLDSYYQLMKNEFQQPRKRLR